MTPPLDLEAIRRWREKLDNPGATWTHDRVANEFKAALDNVDALLDALRDARNAALEEAARDVDCGGSSCGQQRLKNGQCIIAATTGDCHHDMANSIRALKSPPQ